MCILIHSSPWINKKKKEITVHFLKGTELVTTTLNVVELFESHTAQYISDTIKCTLDKWAVELDGILAVVTDNEVKMLEAVQLTLGTNKHISCFACTINLTVENQLETRI